MDPRYSTILETSQSTLVTDYKPLGKSSSAYQSEADLEREFINKLVAQGYERLTFHTEEELVDNLKYQLEKLNGYKFSDKEWKQLLNNYLAKPNDGIVEKTQRVQKDNVYTLTLDNWDIRNIKILDTENVHKNSLQVINQYETESWNRSNRYDVTILVNWLPMVHVELKRRWVNIKEAFNQINRYQRDSFWSWLWLFEYVQIFVISNWTYTKYYSNTTRQGHIENSNDKASKEKKTSNSFEFTSWWADAKNKVIPDLMDFTATFFTKHTLLNIIAKYCVFNSDDKLLVMRPYQICACEKILNKILISTNNKTVWTRDAGGYVWHTTGSWKTLTSFKTAQLATQMEWIKKVLFVVDRKDLDYQTMKEYDNFQKWAADSNTSTRILAEQLKPNNKAKIVITTIQKLDKLVQSEKYKDHTIFDDHIVIIFDECHRSQFWEMQKHIRKAFNKYHLFGFTGTPIFTENKVNGKNPLMQTTEQVFWEKLHTYTIVDAINDRNVLPFKVEYMSTIKEAEDIEDTKIPAIKREEALMAPERIEKVTRYILDHFAQKTKRNEKSYTFLATKNIWEVASAKTQKQMKEIVRLKGFNSILAVQSIDMAKRYYLEFQRQMKDLPEFQKLKIWIIYSFGVNGDDEWDGLIIDENPESTTELEWPDRDFLDEAIKDYNKMFKMNYDTSSDKFQSYYKDISLRMKNRELDLLIVVNMFLTWFDATTLNTLWVDKNLRLHWLLQAFSRTNRILNSIKTFWNIVCFRNLEKATNDSLALFGNEDAKGTVLIKTYDEYMNWYDEKGKHIPGYTELVDMLKDNYECWEVIQWEKRKMDFVRLYGKILKLRNILVSFDEFSNDETLNEREVQDYSSMYIDVYEQFRKEAEGEAVNVNEDLVFEIELLKQIEINVDYILLLVKQYNDTGKTDKKLRTDIDRAVNSSIELRNKKELIDEFIEGLNKWDDIYDIWTKYIKDKSDKELWDIIEAENLKEKETRQFMKEAFIDGKLVSTGMAFWKILPSTGLFKKSTKDKRKTVFEKLTAFFEKFYWVLSQN